MESSTRRIAVVEDDESVRRALGRVLEAMDLETVTFASCEDFLAGGDIAEFDCLLLDYRLDGMNGLELSEHLYASGHRLPWVLLTADPDAPGLDADDWASSGKLLTKPIDADALWLAIERAATQST
ncbi:MAG: response regulator transcription factor [Longimicrobiales bacterium]